MTPETSSEGLEPTIQEGVDAFSATEIRDRVVLLVEDDFFLRDCLALALGDAAFQVLEADNADQGLAILRHRQDVDAVITDIEMPGSLDGVQFAAEIDRSWPHIAIVVASGRMMIEALPSRATFLPKPYDLPIVLATLNELIASANFASRPEP